MVTRSYLFKPFEKVASKYISKDTVGFNAYELVRDSDNILLTDNEGNYSLFEYLSPGVYCGHYFLDTKRGREAIKLCKEMLEFLFSVDFDVGIVTGLTPKDNRKALWMNRQLGFKYIKDVETEIGTMELFTLENKGYNNE